MNRIYDFKGKTKEYTSLSDVVKDAFYDAERYDSTLIVATDEMAGDIVSNIIGVYDLHLAYISYDLYDYSGEYYITLQKNGSDKIELWCEPVYHLKENGEEKAYSSECDILYICDKCDVDILSHVTCNSKTIFSVKE